MADFSERIYFVLATILIIAAGIGIVSSLFSQPLILAYILSGAVIGFLSSNFVAIPTPTETFGFFSRNPSSCINYRFIYFCTFPLI